MSDTLRQGIAGEGAEAPFSPLPVGAQTAGLSLAGPKDYLALLKPRVMSLVIFTALVGMVAAPGPVGNWPLALLSLLAIAVGAGASGALNMWWDADIDAKMVRTENRPIPAGLVSRDAALAFGGTLSLLSVWLLALTANYTAAGLLLFTILFYVVIYSMGLKRRTPENIVIGGAAGALPPVVGWAAMTGTVPVEAWLLFLVIFFWTPPHFWALALLKSSDYEAANVPMMPNAKGAEHTRRLIWIYSLVLFGISLLPLAFGVGSWLYGLVAIPGGLEFLRRALGVCRQGTDKHCWQLFGYSIFYLFALFLAVLAENWMGLHG